MRIDRLTVRERQILDRVARGLTNKAIGNELAISSDTVKNHMSSILAKLRVANRIEALRATGYMRRS